MAFDSRIEKFYCMAGNITPMRRLELRKLTKGGVGEAGDGGRLVLVVDGMVVGGGDGGSSSVGAPDGGGRQGSGPAVVAMAVWRQRQWSGNGCLTAVLSGSGSGRRLRWRQVEQRERVVCVEEIAATTTTTI